ncbi:hypothetical protein [Desulfobulbus alkaliphilus]|uniref:hypothetical protein n=1 Tax=Desulfobulbus alkaliphilus TaxID=869814 RepID=UPI0019642507|nr:hypothetical protein [Desulfobulbus alkaliphilus]MBM9538802.1 hypothetical protein [Desulfobulbus alkaliphilus]
MMISNADNTEAFVWIWLPGETQPVVAGNEKKRVKSAVDFSRGGSYMGGLWVKYRKINWL